MVVKIFKCIVGCVPYVLHVLVSTNLGGAWDGIMSSANGPIASRFLSRSMVLSGSRSGRASEPGKVTGRPVFHHPGSRACSGIMPREASTLAAWLRNTSADRTATTHVHGAVLCAAYLFVDRATV